MSALRRRPGRTRSKAVAAVAGIALVALSVLFVGVGTAVADTLTVSNTTPIAVPATGSANQLGPGSPYPSPITVSGLSGAVTDVNVTLNNVTHPIAQDLDVLLVGPAGQTLLLMSDVANAGGYGVNGTLTFDDSAAGAIPASGTVGTGTYRPTNVNEGADTFPAPAPAPSTATTLSVFNGSTPNGVWSLYAVDDTSGDVGSIGGGWSITVTTAAVAQPGALQFTTGAFRGAEGQGTVALTLERIGGSDGAVSVNVSTGTPATATPGSDFTALNQTVSFANGQTTASVPLTILDDTIVEGVDETLTVTLASPTGGATLGSPSTAVVTIDDNDATFDTTPIAIPGSGTGQTSGAPAAPYPASIHVSGAPTAIAGVEVTLTRFTHQVPVDVDILLVGPGGQNVVLMSDVGGQNPASGVNLTFSDAGTNGIPAAGPLASGTFRVSDDDVGGADAFPAPAPAPSTATSLAAFAGTNPNGTWSLFVVDDASGDVGSIAGGWSLNLLPAVVPSAGGPYTIAEGQPLTLDATGSVAPAGAAFAWDLDGDGQFDDATGISPTVSAATLAALGLGDGPAGPRTITVQVTAAPTVGTASSTVTVTNVAPVATVTNVPSGVVAGGTATVTFGATDPSTADTAAGFTYLIDWGDGTPAQSVSGATSTDVGHTYATAGSFTISLTSTDKDGGTSGPATSTITVDPAVTANAGGPYTIAEGQPLTLDATGSVAPAGALYGWDLDGDGQFDDATGISPTVSAATLAALGLGDGPAGPRTITVQVTAAPTVGTASTTVTVTNVAPIATVTNVPAGVVAGGTATVTFGATDPSSADTAAPFIYQIDWGDGTPAQSVTSKTPIDVGHTYATAGSFTISLTATDKDGGTSGPATSVITVGPAVTANAGGPYTIAEGQPLTLDATGSVAPASALYGWDLDGDGQFDDATGASPTVSAATLAALGLGDGPAGPRTITVQVTAAPTVRTASTTVTVTNVAPVATVQLSGPVVAGVPTTVKVGAEDPSPTDAAGQFEYRIDWDGDGVVDEVLTGPADPAATHTYASAGNVGLSVVAVDKDGAASDPTVVSVTVTSAAPAEQPTSAGGTQLTEAAQAAGTEAGLAATGADVTSAILAAAALGAVGTLLLVAARRGRHPARDRG